MTKYNINPKDQNISIQTIVARIHNGFQIQEQEASDLTEDEKLEYNDSLIIAPDYQREYRSTVADESSLIESVLIGIPIPPVFLANHKLKGAQVLNVVDGQHRLRAFYRYVTNKFKLSNLSILEDEEGKYFNDLEIETKLKILSREIPATIFKDFPGKEFELEIFNRYNKGTKPLSPQEIRNAVYNSRINEMISSFARDISLEKNNQLKDAYNITKDRIQKKKIHESLFVILSILENGIDLKLQKSPQYAEKFMKEKSELQSNNIEEFKCVYNNIEILFNGFNKFILILCNEITFPFSKELYGISNRNYKFQISLAMILSAIFNKMYRENDNFINELENPKNLNDFLDYVSITLNESFLEDPSYSASSTNSEELYKLIEDFDFKI